MRITNFVSYRNPAKPILESQITHFLMFKLRNDKSNGSQTFILTGGTILVEKKQEVYWIFLRNKYPKLTGTVNHQTVFPVIGNTIVANILSCILSILITVCTRSMQR